MKRLIQPTFEEPGNPDELADDSLVIHQRTPATANGSLVVFVHGLGGSRYGGKATWGFFPRFLYEDFPQLDVGLYAYTTLFGRLKLWKSLRLEDEADIFAETIREDLRGYRTIILAGHSMGGLLCMAAITDLVQFRDHLQRIGGLILMATPQLGSQRVPRLLSWFSPDFYALRAHGRFVQGIHQSFADNLLLDESSSDPSRTAIPTWALTGASDFWVDRLSSEIHLPRKRLGRVHGSHTSIVKPPDKEAVGYRRVHGWIEHCLERAKNGSGPALASPAPAAAVPQGFLLQGREYVYVPPGPFTLGSTDVRVSNLNEADGSQAFDVELAEQEIALPGYFIARSPVTQSDYAAFAGATGREVPFLDDDYSRPYNWDRERRTHPEGRAEHPVVLVSWYDAQAYCQWLGGRLPSEAEWEKAARGTDRREWPWGNVWQPGRCNSSEAGLGSTTPVGRFSPAGDSPCGAMDMAGNVWEWCGSLYRDYPYDARDGREDLAAEGRRTMRGGAFGLNRNKVRCAFRNRATPDDRGFTIGFRVAFDRPPAKAVASGR